MRGLKLKINSLLCVSVMLLYTSPALAETIRLKNGQSAEGKIIEKTDSYVKIDVAGVGVTYFKDQIEKIEEGESSAMTQDATSLAGGELYTNKQYGFEIRAPKGWYRHNKPDGNIFFAKQTTGNVGLPTIGVTIDIAPAGMQSALEFVNYIIPQYRSVADRSGGKFTLVSAPERIILETGAEGAVFIFEMVSQDGRGMKSVDCKFMKGNTIISVQGMDHIDRFQTYSKDFTDTIGSFRFLGIAGSRSDGSREIKLTEYLATGKKQTGSYAHQEPHFVLSIPASIDKTWYFTVLNEPRVPFYIVNARMSDAHPLPFISSMVVKLSQEKLAMPPETLFQEVALEHEDWERKTVDKDIKIINKGRVFDLNGLKAFERAIEIPRPDGNNISFHEICVLIDGFLLQVGLNTDTRDFAQDDNDFMGIIGTLSVKQP